MDIKRIDIIATLILNLLHFGNTERFLSCNVTSIEPCPYRHQYCAEASGQCLCEEGYTSYGHHCEEYDPVAAGNYMASIVVSFTLVLVVCGLILVIRKYNLIDYFLHKINERRTNNVIYEDVMIGQDDPPLTP